MLEKILKDVMMILHNFKKSAAVAVALMLTLPQIANAGSGDRSFAKIYTECGLGAIIAPETEAVAAVTNVIWDLGTTAISSNISSPATCKGGKAKVAAFINDSYNEIEKDLASGSGIYLDTLVELTKTPTKSKNTFISTLRKDFATIVANNDYNNLTDYQKAEKLYNIIY